MENGDLWLLCFYFLLIFDYVLFCLEAQMQSYKTNQGFGPITSEKPQAVNIQMLVSFLVWFCSTRGFSFTNFYYFFLWGFYLIHFYEIDMQSNSSTIRDPNWSEKGNAKKDLSLNPKFSSLFFTLFFCIVFLYW